MGLASMFLGEQNPFSQWTAQNQNFLNTLGAGLMQGQNIQHGFQIAGQNVPQAKALDLQQAEKLKADALAKSQANYTIKLFQDKGFTDLVDLANAGAPMSELMGEYFKRIQPADPADPWDQYKEVNGYMLKMGQAGPEIAWQPPNGDKLPQTSFATTPIWGQFEDGTFGFGVMADDGKFHRVDTTGFKPLSPFQKAADTAAGSQFGQNTGQAQFDVQGADLTLNRAIDALNAIRTNKAGIDEQFGNILGIPQQMTPAWPGSKKATLQNDVSRASGIAFLEARQMLKGGGAITDFESQKAETAFANIQLALEKGDKEQFLRALDDFESAVRDGYKKLAQRAGAMPNYGGDTAPVFPAATAPVVPETIVNPKYPGVTITPIGP